MDVKESLSLWTDVTFVSISILLALIPAFQYAQLSLQHRDTVARAQAYSQGQGTGQGAKLQNGVGRLCTGSGSARLAKQPLALAYPSLT